jgi:hypothetical protein
MSRRTPKPSTLIALLALVLATTGTATAAGLIGSKQIKNGAVTSKDLKNGGVKFKDIAKGTKAKLKGAKGDTGAQGIQGVQGIQGERGPSDAFYLQDLTHVVSLIESTQVVLDHTFPVGDYVHSVSVDVENTDNVDGQVTCRLQQATSDFTITIGRATVALEPGEIGTLSFTGAHQQDLEGTTSLRCNNDNGDSGFAKLTDTNWTVLQVANATSIAN